MKELSICQSPCYLALVSFPVLSQIKPHAPLLVCPPVNSFKFLPCDHTPPEAHQLLDFSLKSWKSLFCPLTPALTGMCFFSIGQQSCQQHTPQRHASPPQPLTHHHPIPSRHRLWLRLRRYRVSQKNLATISLKVSVGGWGVSRSSPAISQFVSAQFQLHRACHKLLAREIP